MNNNFRGQFFLLFLLLLTCVDAFSQYAYNSKPNIFIYIADDHNSWDYTTFGNTQVKTTHFDRLVNEGLSFSNAYTSQAICCLLYTSPSPRDRSLSRMPSSA